MVYKRHLLAACLAAGFGLNAGAARADCLSDTQVGEMVANFVARTPAATPLTTPDTSVPGTNGKGGLRWYLPATTSSWPMLIVA